MQGWHTTYLGMRELPREISTFEMQAFFTFECAEREVNPAELAMGSSGQTFNAPDQRGARAHQFALRSGGSQSSERHPDLILRRYARRLASRSPSAGAKIKEPARTVEVACFLRYCLLSATDQLILMVLRRINDLWRQAAAGVPGTVNWADLYQTLLTELAGLSVEGAVPDSELRARLEALVSASRQRKPPSRASLVRERLIAAIRPVRSLLMTIAKLPWQATGNHPAIVALTTLRNLYSRRVRKLPDDVAAPSLGAAWRNTISGYDRDRAFRALEVATLFALRRAVRNGSVWIEHSLSFRDRERLFLPTEQWKTEGRRHYARLSLPTKPAAFLEPLLTRVRTGVDAVAEAARSGVLRIDDDLHLPVLPADDEDPEVLISVQN